MTLPDWTTGVKLYAVDGDGNFLPVLVDPNGQLYVVIQGELEGITGNVTVDQNEKDREIQGADGATLRTVAVDANGQLIMVPRGQSGNYMTVDANGYLTTVMKGIEDSTLRTLAVDASGNIIAVVKGAYGGTLKTLATDADGNLQIVPYDPADVWGNTVGMGLAELASITTPCKRYDRRGNVIFWDSFENGLGGWVISEQGTGALVRLSPLRASHGGYSVQLVGGSDGSMWGAIERDFGYPSATKHGLEAAISWGADVGSIELYFTFRDGTTFYRGAVRYVPSTDDFEYYDDGAVWQDIDASKALLDNDYVFHRIKFVIDADDKEYVRALIDEEEYDLSGISLYSTASASAPLMACQVILVSTSGNNATGYVDSVIVTENEPS